MILGKVVISYLDYEYIYDIYYIMEMLLSFVLEIIFVSKIFFDNIKFFIFWIDICIIELVKWEEKYFKNGVCDLFDLKFYYLFFNFVVLLRFWIEYVRIMFIRFSVD